MPDLAQTVKLGSDHCENLTNVFYGAKNGNFIEKSPNIFSKLSEIKIFTILFLLIVDLFIFIVRDVIRR